MFFMKKYQHSIFYYYLCLEKCRIAIEKDVGKFYNQIVL